MTTSSIQNGIMRIKKLVFAAGEDSGSKDNLVVEPPTVTILVGPNNAGKSQCIGEIHDWMRGAPRKFKVLKEIDLSYPSSAAPLVGLLRQFQVEPINDNERRNQGQGHIIISRPAVVGDNAERAPVHPSSLDSWLSNLSDSGNRMNVHMHSVKFLTLMLDAETRLNLTKERIAGHHDDDPQNHLWYLNNNRAARKDVSEHCQKAFPGYYFTIDPIKRTHFRIRLSKEKPTEDVEDGYGGPTREYHRKGQLITDMGDGVKCFVGLIAAVVALKQKCLLIDDPEAFLHPPVARHLGASLIELAMNYGTQIFLSTHSGEFLLGCLETPRPEASEPARFNVIRLTYDGEGAATATRLDNDTLVRFMREPILRSARVLDGLFHSAVIITEGDSDRVIYEEINRRLLEAKDKGVQDGAFLRAQSRDTVYKMLGPLRSINVPTAAIIDIDIFYDPKDSTQDAYPIQQLVNAADISSDETAEILQKAKTVRNAVNPSIVRRSFQKNGIAHEDLTSKDRKALQSLIDSLAEHGIFVVPGGTLESWLKHLDIKGESSSWVVNCLEKLGADPSNPSYVHPDKGDVWDFIRRVARWTQE